MLLTLLIAAIAAPAEPTAELLAIERETYEAIRAKDVARFGKLLSSDFVYRAPGQPDVDKAMFLKGIAALPGEILEIDGEGVKVALHGDAALVTGLQRVKLKLPDGSIVSAATAFSDLFVKRAGRWLLAVAFGVELPAR